MVNAVADPIKAPYSEPLTCVTDNGLKMQKIDKMMPVLATD
jgi:hypothetical protein